MLSLPFRGVVSHKSSRSAQLELAPQKSYILRKTPSPNQLEESTARFSVLAALFSISEGRGTEREQKERNRHAFDFYAADITRRHGRRFEI